MFLVKGNIKGFAIIKVVIVFSFIYTNRYGHFKNNLKQLVL